MPGGGGRSFSIFYAGYRENKTADAHRATRQIATSAIQNQ